MISHGRMNLLVAAALLGAAVPMAVVRDRVSELDMTPEPEPATPARSTERPAKKRERDRTPPDIQALKLEKAAAKRARKAERLLNPPVQNRSDGRGPGMNSEILSERAKRAAA
jgi:hypothetical protein